MKCGFYETEITPPLGSTIYGYFTGRVNKGVNSKLYAKACVIENEGKQCALLVLDALHLPAQYPEFIKNYISEKTGIDANSILIATTHAHTGFPTADNLGGFKYTQDWANGPKLNVEVDKLAFEMIKLLAADTVVHASRKLQDAKVSFGMGEVEGVSYVREYYLTDGTVHTNPAARKSEVVKSCGEPDVSLPVFFFTDTDGNPLGSITSFALHHDIISGSEISSDYSGVVARKLKEKYGLDFVSMFFAGFCGNINHANYIGEQKGEPFLKTYIETAEIIYDELIKVIDKSQPISDVLDVKLETVKIQKRQVPDEFVESSKKLAENPPQNNEKLSIEEPYSDGMKYLAHPRTISYYGVDRDKVFDVPVQVIKLGDSLVYALPGEVFCQFGDKIRKSSPSEKIMLISCANHTDNPYIPTKEMFLPFVYESSYYSARFEPDAGDKMTDKAIEIAKKIM